MWVFSRSAVSRYGALHCALWTFATSGNLYLKPVGPSRSAASRYGTLYCWKLLLISAGIPDQGLCLNSFHCYAKPCDGRAHAPLASCGIPKTCSKKKQKTKIKNKKMQKKRLLICWGVPVTRSSPGCRGSREHHLPGIFGGSKEQSPPSSLNYSVNRICAKCICGNIFIIECAHSVIDEAERWRRRWFLKTRPTK